MKSVFSTLLFIGLCTGLISQSGTEYQFQHKVRAELRQYNTNMPEGSYNYTFLFPKSGDYIGMVGDLTQGGQTIKTKAVFDMARQYVVTLIDQGGMKMGMRMSTDSEVAGKIEERTDGMTVRKTGNEKEILGYSAVEYEVSDGESYSLIWIAEELGLPNFYDALTTINRQPNELMNQVPKGFMLLMTAWPNGKDSKEKVELVVTEIQMDSPETISTTGYQIMDMPNR